MSEELQPVDQQTGMADAGTPIKRRKKNPVAEDFLWVYRHQHLDKKQALKKCPRRSLHRMNVLEYAQTDQKGFMNKVMSMVEMFDQDAPVENPQEKGNAEMLVDELIDRWRRRKKELAISRRVKTFVTGDDGKTKVVEMSQAEADALASAEA